MSYVTYIWGAIIQSTIPPSVILIFCCFATAKGGRQLKGVGGQDIREGLASKRDGDGEGNGRMSRKKIEIEDTGNRAAKDFMTLLFSGSDRDTREQEQGRQKRRQEKDNKKVKATGKVWSQCSSIFGNELHSCFYKRPFLGEAHT